MSQPKRLLLLGVAVVFLAGCRNWRKWKTTPDLYQVDCNVPYAQIYVYSEHGRLLSTQQAGETFPKFDTDGTIEVTAKGYHTFSGPVSILEPVGKKSWYVKLRKKSPGDLEDG